MRALALLTMSLLVRPAVAQDAFSLQNFRPAVDSKGYVTLNGSELLGHLDVSLGLVGSYAHEPLRLERDGRAFTVEHFLTPQLQAALGLWRWLELGVSLPVHVMFGSRSPRFVEAADANYNDELHFAGQFVGDIGAHIKGRILNGHRYPFGLAALLSLYAPTGRAAQLLGEGQFTLRPELIADKELGRARRVRLALNLGALVRPSVRGFVDHGATLAGDPHVNGGAPFCAPAGGAVAAPGTCGTGLGRSLGTQLTYGVAASVAIVRERVEIVGEAFGYADLTGQADAHPLEALAAVKVYLAAKSHFEIGGGAGLLPGMTGSPRFRVFVGFVFEPAIGDRDGDGIRDDVDRCPDEPEDFDDFEDEDGCPELDNDGDTIFDRDDACPNLPGPFENHGCPWPDSDGDRLADKDDDCPHEPGPQELNGCPPTAMRWRRGGRALVLRSIQFETAKATLKPVSFPILDAVAESLDANPQILAIEIQGHADERGDDDYNLQLTDARAAAVRAYLVGRGVAAARLQSRGYGETRPLCRAHDERCWSQNRRVEFVILRRSD